MYILENKKITIISIVINIILLISIGLLIHYFNNKKDYSYSKETITAMSSENTSKDECINEKKIMVDIKGNVKEPGVYEVNEGDIINDVINKAGGILNGSSLKYINLSKRVVDEMVIYIYTDKEIKKMKDNIINNEEVKTNIDKEVCVCPEENIIKCEGSSIIESNNTNNSNETTNTGESLNNKISINKASKEELMNISGIGESKAISIIEYRNNNGSFKTIEEIMNVSGIGTALFEKIKNYITV